MPKDVISEEQQNSCTVMREKFVSLESPAMQKTSNQATNIN